MCYSLLPCLCISFNIVCYQSRKYQCNAVSRFVRGASLNPIDEWYWGLTSKLLTIHHSWTLSFFDTVDRVWIKVYKVIIQGGCLLSLFLPSTELTVSNASIRITFSQDKILVIQFMRQWLKVLKIEQPSFPPLIFTLYTPNRLDLNSNTRNCLHLWNYTLTATDINSDNCTTPVVNIHLAVHISLEASTVEEGEIQCPLLSEIEHPL